MAMIRNCYVQSGTKDDLVLIASGFARRCRECDQLTRRELIHFATGLCPICFEEDQNAKAANAANDVRAFFEALNRRKP